MPELPNESDVDDKTRSEGGGSIAEVPQVSGEQHSVVGDESSSVRRLVALLRVNVTMLGYELCQIESLGGGTAALIGQQQAEQAAELALKHLRVARKLLAKWVT